MSSFCTAGARTRKASDAFQTGLKATAASYGLIFPGFGQSPPPPYEGWGVENYADNLAAFYAEFEA